MEIDVFTLAHEIKNPLCISKGYLEMLNSDNFDKYRNIINDNINEAISVLDDYLSFNRLTINKEIMDLIMLLEEVINNYSNLYHKNINLITVYEELFLNGDYNRLKQAINNILKNSIEANANNINVCIKVIDNNVILNIIDDGIGILDPSLIGSNLYTTKVKGNGIGTLITKEIIKAHDGYIIYNNNDQEGCVVRIKLPLDI